METNSLPETVHSLTDSILSVYGDMESPGEWGAYVMSVESYFGSHPIGSAHREIVSPSFADHWLRRFGIRPVSEQVGREPGPETANGMFCSP